MGNNVITLKGLTKSYDMGHNKLEVLKGIDIEINQGEFVAILGPSGSGKSTIMNIIGCIDTKSGGAYHLDGVSIENKSSEELADIRNQKIGFVFQKFNLLPRMTTLRNVQLPLLLRGYTSAESAVVAEKYLDMVGLGDRMNHKPIELSGGQQQRVAIARALIGDPELILADEPTGNLDSKSGEEIMKLFLKLNDEGNTIILITHDLNVAKQAKRIIKLKDGSIEDDFLN